MRKATKYRARRPDAHGFVRYTGDEHAVWAELYARQTAAVVGKACDEFLHGLDLLKLPADRVPQLEEVSRVLRHHSGWELVHVPALISAANFFDLLAERRFPAATFVRRRDELDYLQEPDIFHELFGHTPLLTNRYFAEFTQAYGRIGLAAGAEDRELLARLYWFTVEFGLLQKPGAPLRIYGGGILSSIGETSHALASAQPQRRRFDLVEVLRMPFRVDVMQPVYYVIEDLRELFELTRSDLKQKMAEARRLGDLPALFPGKQEAA
jgi:phenylalanine-4-hydroxylase